MSDSKVHRLFERDSEEGTERALGGAIVGLPVNTAEGQLNELEITPVDVEHIKESFWTDQYVCLKLADRMVWLSPQEVLDAIELLEVALKAARENVARTILP